MHILVIGGSGRNGCLVIKDALSRGHTVTALVRSSSSLEAATNLTIVQGNPLSQPDLESALIKPTVPTAIITALSQRRLTDSPFAAPSPDSRDDMVTAGLHVLIGAIRASALAANPPKIVVNSAHGAGSSWSSLILPMRLLLKSSNMRSTFEDHTTADTAIRASGLTFVLARAARLSEGEATEVKVLPDDGKGVSWNPTVSRESLAKWMVTAAESGDWDGRAPVLTN